QDGAHPSQATFLALVRKAGSIGKRASLASWLYKVAFRVALEAKARVSRRTVVAENRVVGLAPDPTTAIMGRDLRAVLDEEVSRLPEKYRVPFVLCHLEGKTIEQVAPALACPFHTIGTRLARARQRLRARLTRRGVGLSAAALIPVLGRQATAAVPAALASRTVEAARLVAAG